jgi:DNA repair protein RecO (recombination protein O)
VRPAIVTPAILLRATPYGESDRVVTLLGRTTGRVSALARGARKSVRRFGGGLGMGAGGEATLRDRPGAELASLEAFEVLEGRAELGTDVGRTAHAAYALELCDRLCAPRQPEPRVYDWLDDFLRRLTASAPLAERLRVFELGLLERLGLGPSLNACASCGRDDLADESTRWQPERGGIVCRACGGVGLVVQPKTRRALTLLGETELSQVETLSIDRDVNAACRQAILDLIRLHVPGPLRSLEFIGKLSGHSVG